MNPPQTMLKGMSQVNLTIMRTMSLTKTLQNKISLLLTIQLAKLKKVITKSTRLHRMVICQLSKRLIFRISNLMNKTLKTILKMNMVTRTMGKSRLLKITSIIETMVSACQMTHQKTLRQSVLSNT